MDGNIPVSGDGVSDDDRVVTVIEVVVPFDRDHPVVAAIGDYAIDACAAEDKDAHVVSTTTTWRALNDLPPHNPTAGGLRRCQSSARKIAMTLTEGESV